MIDFYDYAQADTMLNTLVQDRCKESRSLPMLKSKYAYLKANKFQLSHEIPFRGARITDEDKETEATFAIQGMVHATVLPPFGNVSRTITDRQAHHLRQSVSLTGNGSAAFKIAVENMLEIHARYERLLPDGCTIKDPSFITTNGHEGPTVDFSNRFFTPLKYAESPQMVMPADVVAWNDMANAEKLGYIYTEDNDVRFMEAVKKDDKWRFHQIKARDIHRGDIVEIQFNLTLICVKANTFALKPVLREIARFNDSLSLMAAMRKQAASVLKASPMPPNRIKRSITYVDEDEDDIEEDERRLKEIKLS